MTPLAIREQLHRQIDSLPDDFVQFIADFVSFVVHRRKLSLDYDNWGDDQWQEFALGQFFRDGDEVEYSLDDAEEIYHP